MIADGLLLLAALIWGFAFVAQRAGMAYMGPFTFNAIRFLIGGLMLGFIAKTNLGSPGEKVQPPKGWWKKALLTGAALFTGASLQQIGLVQTQAGKAGFITGLYVVFVPLLGLILGRKTSLRNWMGAFLAVIGLFFLSVNQDLTFKPSDLQVLIGAVVWAIHVLLIAQYSSSIGAIRLSITQFLICGALSAIAAFIFEKPAIPDIARGWLPLAYGGFISVTVGYTLQVVAQRKAHPTHAAILLSLESVFAAIGGWFLLGERLTSRNILGAVIMLAGMLVSQISWFNFRVKNTN